MIDELTLEERMERLEHQNRRLKVEMLAVVAVVAGLVCVAATEPVAKVVRAERFELVDSKGTMRGDFSVLPNGSSGLALFDKDGRRNRATLAVLADGTPHLYLNDEDGRPRATLETPGDGHPALALIDKGGDYRAQMGLDADGRPWLRLSGREASQIIISVERDGNPGFAIWDRNGIGRAVLWGATDGRPAFWLRDKDNKVIWHAP